MERALVLFCYNICAWNTLWSYCVIFFCVCNALSHYCFIFSARGMCFGILLNSFRVVIYLPCDLTVFISKIILV